MKGLTDEIMSKMPPLFPRLHVNDTEREKGGRTRSQRWNQIALYERLTVSSPRHAYDLPSTRAGGGRFCKTDAPSNLANKLKSASNGVTIQNRTAEKKIKPNSLEQNDRYKFKDYSFKNLGSLVDLQFPNVNRLLRDSFCGNDRPSSADLSLQVRTNSRKATGEVVNVVIAGKSAEKLRKSCKNDGIIQSQNCKSLKRPQEPQRNQKIRTNAEDDELTECLGDSTKESSFKPKTQSFRKCLVGFNKECPESYKDVSGSSVMDSASSLSVSHGDIVKVIGYRQFWKIRTALINQQRMFAAQVFDLHRLISVQKMLARLPSLLPESAEARKSSSPVLETTTKAQKLASDEHMTQKLPLPSINTQPVTFQPSPEVNTKKPSSPWWFPTPANQWLVPVMSPSEGLVYKPYAGSCSPTSGFMAPIYGNDLFNTSFKFPPNQFSSHSCFQATSMSDPVAEQMNMFAQMQSSFSHISQAIPISLRKSKTSKDSETQGSTAGSPTQRPKRDVLPLFPTEPSHSNAETDDEHKQHAPIRAIKAVPHHPLSASESAARIFQSIQEERRHYHCRIS